MSNFVIFMCICLLVSIQIARCDETVAPTDDFCKGVTCASGETCQTKFCQPYCPPGRFCAQYVRPCGSECVPSTTTTPNPDFPDSYDYCKIVTCRPGEICRTKYCVTSCPPNTPCTEYARACGGDCVPLPTTTADSNIGSSPTV